MIHSRGFTLLLFSRYVTFFVFIKSEIKYFILIVDPKRESNNRQKKGGGREAEKKKMKNRLLKQLAIIITASMIVSPCAVVYADDGGSFVNFTDSGVEIVEIDDTAQEQKGTQEEVIWFGDSSDAADDSASSAKSVVGTVKDEDNEKLQNFETVMSNPSEEGVVAESVTFMVSVDSEIKDGTIMLESWNGFSGNGEIAIEGGISSYTPGETFSFPEGTSSIEITLSGIIPLSDIPSIIVSGAASEGVEGVLSMSMDYVRAEDENAYTGEIETSAVIEEDIAEEHAGADAKASSVEEPKKISDDIENNTEDGGNTEGGDNAGSESGTVVKEDEPGSDIPTNPTNPTDPVPSEDEMIKAEVTAPVISIDKETVTIHTDGTGHADDNSALITVDGLKYFAPQPKPVDQSGQIDQPGQDSPASAEQENEDTEPEDADKYKNIKVIIDIPDNLYPDELTLPEFENAKVTGVTVDNVIYRYHGNVVNILRRGPIALHIEIEDTTKEVVQTSPATVSVQGIIEEDASEGSIEETAVVSGSVEDADSTYGMNDASIVVIKEKPEEKPEDTEPVDGGDDPVEPVDPIEPVEPVDPVGPVEPVKPEPEDPSILDYLPAPVKEVVLEVVDFTQSLFPDDTEVTTRSAEAKATRNSDSASRELADTVSQRTQTERIEDSRPSTRKQDNENAGSGSDERDTGVTEGNSESQTGMSLEEEISTASKPENENSEEGKSEGEDNTRSKNNKRFIEGGIIVGLLAALGGIGAYLIYTGKKEDDEEEKSENAEGEKPESPENKE